MSKLSSNAAIDAQLVASLERLDKLTVRMEEMMHIMTRMTIASDELIKRENEVTARETAIGHIARTKQQAIDAGMKIIIGKKGGMYYITKGGNRAYVKDE